MATRVVLVATATRAGTKAAMGTMVMETKVRACVHQDRWILFLLLLCFPAISIKFTILGETLRMLPYFSLTLLR